MTFAAKSVGALLGLRAFARSRDGIAAVEFAALLPFMLMMYIGGVEVSDAIIINLRIGNTVETVTNLTTQYTVIHNADMTGVLNAASAIMSPISTTGLVVTVSEVTTNAQGQGAVTWSDSLNGTARPVGQSVTLPVSLQTANVTYVWTEASYTYNPMGFVLKSALKFSDQSYMYPRQGPITRINS
jgi:Flp pilus assembly protein TadG